MVKVKEFKVIHTMADGTQLTDKQFKESYLLDVEMNIDVLRTVVASLGIQAKADERRRTYESVKERQAKFDEQVSLLRKEFQL